MPTFAQVLRAACVLSDTSTATLAASAGIRQSRVARILRGQEAPAGGEVDALLAAVGLSAALTSQIARAGGAASGTFRSLSLLLASLPPFDVETVPLDRCRLVVDKLALTFHGIDGNALRGVARSFALPRAAKPYGTVITVGGATLSLGPLYPNTPPCRVELAPLASTARADELLTRIFPRLAASSARVSQIAVAVDVPVRHTDVQALGGRSRKVRTFYGARAETIYSGCYRIYDKHQERIDAGDAGDATSPCTRFEVMLSPRRELVHLPSLSDPFTDLQLFVLASAGLPLERRLLVDWARAWGVGSLRHEIGRPALGDLHRELERTPVAAAIPHPSVVFAAQWPSVAARILSSLRARGLR